jgi:hypothetical protein
MIFLIQCPDCGHAQERDIEELGNDSRCNVCTFYLGWEDHLYILFRMGGSDETN